MATINLGRVGFVNHGIYDNGMSYKINSIVKYNGSLYASKTVTTGNLPTNISYWDPWIDLESMCDLSTNQDITGVKTFIAQPIGIAKGSVGLANVDDTSDANKPVSTAQQTALNLKLDSTSYTAEDVLAKLKTVDGSNSGLDADLLVGMQSATGATASTVPLRDANADLTSRAFITTYAAQSTTPSSTVNIFFRDTDNIIKPLTATAFKAWLDSIGAIGMKIKNVANLSGSIASGTTTADVTIPFTITDPKKTFISGGIVTLESSNTQPVYSIIGALNTYIPLHTLSDGSTSLKASFTSSTNMHLEKQSSGARSYNITVIEYE